MDKVTSSMLPISYERQMEVSHLHSYIYILLLLSNLSINSSWDLAIFFFSKFFYLNSYISIKHLYLEILMNKRNNIYSIKIKYD